jgi:dephospho-CoA kinase
LKSVIDLTTTWVLTGAIGTGKSTVGSLLAARGARVIDADRIGHAVIDPSGAGFGLVADQWPEVIVDGRVDRRALGRIVFGDAAELRRLEAITHPLIVTRLKEMIRSAGHSVAVVEVSVPHLPVDERWGRIVVVAPENDRIARLLDRGLTETEIMQRMAAQPPAEEWARDGDIVVDNGGDLVDLEHQIDRVWEDLAALAH